MSSSEDEDVLSILNVNNINKQLPKREYWVHPYWKEMQGHSGFNVFKELNMYPKKFQSFYRMRKESFELLISKIGPRIIKKDTNYRCAISPEERVLITLR